MLITDYISLFYLHVCMYVCIYLSINENQECRSDAEDVIVHYIYIYIYRLVGWLGFMAYQLL